MIFNEIDSALFTVKKVPCFAEVSKNNHIFSNYAIVNTTDGKILSAVSDEFQFISNEQLLKNVKSIIGEYPSWYSTDGRNYYFYAIYKQITADFIIWIEIINSYDGHITRQVNYMFEIEKMYLFTDWKAIINFDNPAEITWTALMDWTKIIDKWKNTSSINDVIPSNVPNKYISLMKSSYTDDKLERIKSLLPLIYSWHLNSFLEARRYSIKLFNHILM